MLRQVAYSVIFHAMWNSVVEASKSKPLSETNFFVLQTYFYAGFLQNTVPFHFHGKFMLLLFCSNGRFADYRLIIPILQKITNSS